MGHKADGRPVLAGRDYPETDVRFPKSHFFSCNFANIEKKCAPPCNKQSGSSRAGAVKIHRFQLAITVMLLLIFGQDGARAGSMRAATDDWPPFRISTEKGFTGLDLDLIGELSRRIGTKIDVFKMPWGRALASMESGAVDLPTGTTGPSTLLTPTRHIILVRQPFTNSGRVRCLSRDTRTCRIT
jgi:hypothetical protein